MLGSRPDLVFCINKLAQYGSQPTVRHWNGVKRILRYVKGTVNAKLTLSKSVPREGLERIQDQPSTSLVIGYFDAAFMDNTTDRTSSMGYIFFVANSPVSWVSKKQRVVALSTTEAEYLAGTEATKEAIWINHFLTEIGIPKIQILLIRLIRDKQSAIALTKNPEYHARTKHIQGKQRFISEMVEQGIITVQYVHTTGMIADALTKPLPKEKYHHLMKLMSVGCPAMPPPKTWSCLICATSFTLNNELHKHSKINTSHMKR